MIQACEDWASIINDGNLRYILVLALLHTCFTENFNSAILAQFDQDHHSRGFPYLDKCLESDRPIDPVLFFPGA